MRLSINQQMVTEIDALTRRHAQATASKGELKQLSALFGQSYLGDLRQLLQGSFEQHPRVRIDVTIRLAWIDKIPLADIAADSERTELGDAVIFAFDELVFTNGMEPQVMAARAVLLQAKITNSLSQIATPTVPVSRMSGSTKKEFELLSAWPTFDLYKSSRSRSSLAQKIDLRGGKSGTLPFGWYIAAPRIQPRIKRPITSRWTSWWMASPPILNNSFDLTFGGLLQAFFIGKPVNDLGNVEVGAQFQCKNYPPCPDGLTGWDRVCAEIIRIVENSNAPQSVFGSMPTGRMATSDPIGAPLAYLSYAGHDATCAPQSWVSPARLFRRFFDWLRGRKRRPVLIIRTRVTET